MAIDRREFLKAGAVLAAPVILPGAGPARKDWFRKQPRVFLLDFQMPDLIDQGVPGMPHFFQKLDPAAIVDQVAAAGVNVLLVHAKCNQGNCYYNTKVGHKHTDLGDRDLMAELSSLCRKRALTILYYVQLSRDRRSFRNPEHRAIDADGEPVRIFNDNPLLAGTEERQVVCMNGPHRQYIKSILAELSRGYDFDGFWLDCYNWWGRVNPCFCDFCKKSYRAATGAEIPKKSLLVTAEGKRYIEWRTALNTRILTDVISTVREINPALTVTHNGSAVNSVAFTDWEFCDGDDYVSHEYHFSEGYGNLSLLTQRNRALKAGVPYEIEIWRFANRHGGQRSAMRAYQVRRPEVLLTEMATVAANGGFPQYYDQVRPDGTLEQRSLRMLAPAFKELARRQPWAAIGEPIPYAAVLWSKTTESFALKEAQTLYRDGTTGAFLSLMESHLPVCILAERDLQRRSWHGLRCIVLESVECLSLECCEALAAFVSSGGGLVVTGRTSLRDARGRLLQNFALADLLGADFEGMTDKWYSFLTPERSHAIIEGLELGFPMSVYQNLQTRVKARPGAQAYATIVNPLPGFHMGYPPHEKTASPALLVRDHGKGRVVYCTAPLGAIYTRVNHPDYRTLLRNAVQWSAAAPPPVTLQAPETVEMTAWRDGKRTIVHLVNRTGAGLPQGEGAYQHDVIPVHDLRLHVDTRIEAARAVLQPAGRELLLKRTAAGLEIEIPRLDIWEIIELTPAA